MPDTLDVKRAVIIERAHRLFPGDGPPPNATYVPNRGFAGEDEFAYETTDKGPGNRTIQLRVLVKATVRAPGP
ncbi:MAG: hypothetical protein FJX78_00495 [Armatimonadetes bacterium]|nr:hypothetical protein [Armatimonadota bacterium]